MGFEHVDRIVSIEPEGSIVAFKAVTRTDPAITRTSGPPVINPAVIAEAAGQAAGWMAMKMSDFRKLPIVTHTEGTTLGRPTPIGQMVRLEAWIDRLEDDLMQSHARASVDGETVLEHRVIRHSLLPTDDYDDSRRLHRRFANLYKPDQPPRRVPKLFLLSSFRPNQNDSHLDGFMEVSNSQRAAAFKCYSDAETYFSNHFPKQPAVPGAVLIAAAAELGGRLVTSGEDPFPAEVIRTRFRKFVRPGDMCVFSATKSKNRDDDGWTVKVTARVENTRVMDGEFSYRVVEPI